MLKKSNKKILIGLIVLVVGVSIFSYDYLLQKKQFAFSYMIDKIYGTEFYEEVPVEEKEIVVKKNEVVKENTTKQEQKSSSTVKNTTSYYYIGTLEIPKINFKRGFVDINSKDNTVDKNIQILKSSDYPNIDKGNFMIAGHSGVGTLAYFKNLYKLVVGDSANVYYKNVKYTYKLTNIVVEKKKSQISVFRDFKKTTLTLITCTKDDRTSQSIYVFELVSKKAY